MAAQRCGLSALAYAMTRTPVDLAFDSQAILSAWTTPLKLLFPPKAGHPRAAQRQKDGGIPWIRKLKNLSPLVHFVHLPELSAETDPRPEAERDVATKLLQVGMMSLRRGRRRGPVRPPWEEGAIPEGWRPPRERTRAATPA